MKHIYVSPHSDDVALSCGGRIIANEDGRDDVLILNMFSSDREHAPSAAADAFIDSISIERALEDKAAWASLGIEAQCANLPEALLRQTFPFLLLPRRSDEAILERLYDVLLRVIAAHPGASIYFPAGIGNHVDHLACRVVAFRLLNEDRLKTIRLYEDIPYSWLKFLRDQYYRKLARNVDFDAGSALDAFRPGGEGLLAYVRNEIVPFPRGRKLFTAVWLANAVRGRGEDRLRGNEQYRGRIMANRLDDDIVAKKEELLGHYRSQLPMLFGKTPKQMLLHHHDSLSREVIIEIAKVRTDNARDAI